MQNKVVKLDKSDKLINVLLFILTLTMMGIMSFQLTNPPILDEVGTMANSAYMTGYNWSECIQATGNHNYKIGMPVFYIPAFMLIKDPFILYKVLVFIGTVFVSFVPVFAYTIIKKHLLPTVNTEEQGVVALRIIPAMIALATAFVPSIILHSLYAKSEPMLTFLPWPIMLCIFECFDAQEEDRKKKWYICSALAGFLSVYAYLTHTRGIIVIIALVITNAFIYLFTRRKALAWIPYLMSLGVSMIAERIVSGYYKEKVYIYGLKHGTLDSAGLDQLKNILTRSGFLSFVKEIIGWLYNVFVSTYGMIIIGLLVGIYVIIRAVFYKQAYGSRENIPAKETAGIAFAFANFCGAFMLGTLFFFRHVHALFINTTDYGRADRVVFGRYTVCAVGPIVLLALFYLIYRTDLIGLKTRVTAITAYLIILFLFVFYVSPWIDGHSANSRYFISLCTFIEYPYPGGTSNILENMCIALQKAGELAAVIFIPVLLLTWKPLYIRIKVGFVRFIAAALVIAIAYSGIIISVNYINARLARDKFLYKRVVDTALVLNEIAEKTDIEEKYPYVLNIDTTVEIKHHQAASIAYNFGSGKTLAAKQDNMFIVTKNGRYLEKYYNDDYYLLDCFDYENAFKDMVFVKGNDLASDLMAVGYSVTKYTGELTK